MRLLGVLRLAGVSPRRIRQVRLAVQLTDLRPGGSERGVRQRRRVGPHVGDVAVLVQPLCGRHAHGRRHAQLAARLLLQRRGHERRGRTTGVRLALHRVDRDRSFEQRSAQPRGGGLIEQHRIRVGQLPGLIEVLAGGQTGAVEFDERRRERRLVLVGGGVVERGAQVPPGGGPEPHAFPFPLHDHPGRHRLHPAGGAGAVDATPQHRRQPVAVDAVEDAPSLLGVDEPAVELTGMIDGVLDRVGRDLVEHHPTHRDLRVEHLEQMPRDGLPLAVLIGREIELVGVGHQRLQLADVVLLVGRDDVDGLEVVLGVHADDRPLPILEVLRHVGHARRQVADVTDGGLDHVVVAEKARDGLGLGW